ncbi:MAG: superoxide dismutase, Fe-Mn family [Patescibacteria group bacterium]|nr:superoxide dismutase, Fe-Mn family [Patescibacteria group bacterium]
MYEPNYKAEDFSRLLGIEGMSDTLLNNHFTLYAGYVTQTNKLISEMKTKEPGTPEFNELHRRFGWEWNGMRLHELYFENMTKEGSTLTEGGEMKKILEAVWGSVENWQKEFIGIGAMRGIGWAVLALDMKSHMVFNTWVNEHDAGHLAGAVPLLVMDVFEHAYITDYGIKRADYIGAFVKALDWSVVEKRLVDAMR